MNRLTKSFIALIALLAFALPVQAAPQGAPNIRRQAYRITTATTTAVSAQTSYIASMQICVTASTSGTVVVQNKDGTPKILYSSGTVTAPLNYTLTVSNDEAALLSTGGIDIVTTGTITVAVFITYFVS